MGVDTRIQLKPQTQLRNVADVIGVLLGCIPRLEPLGGTNSKSCRVAGVKVASSTVETCADILIVPEHGETRNILYHFESEDGCRGLLLRCYAENIALGVRLVEFFGGSIDYNDSDESDCDFTAKGLPFASADAGQSWDQLQEAIHSLRPLTYSEVVGYKKHATYN